jgi:outer membrane protein assembly factor BamB
MPTPSLSHLQDQLNLGLSCIKELWKYEAKSWVTSVHAADINGDGDIEVLAGSRDGRVYILTPDRRLIHESIIGKKSWISSVVGLSFPLEQPSQPAARMIVAGRDGNIYALDKDGQTLSKELYSSSGSHTGSSVPLDFASQQCWYSSAPHPVVQLHVGASAPSSVVFGSEDYSASALDISTGSIRWHFPTRGKIQSIFSCDLNGDGELETLVGSEDQHLYILNSCGCELARLRLDHPIQALFAADIDGDGAVEILLGTRAKNLLVLTPDLQKKWSCQLSSRILSLAVADVNNDQRLEILAASDDQYLSILNDEGKVIWRYNFNARLYSLYALDLDHDGHIEVLAGSENNSVQCLRIQLSKDLDKKIYRSYTTLVRTNPESLLNLTSKQYDMLQDVLGSSTHLFDPTLHMKDIKQMLEKNDYTGALLTLLKLKDQHVEMLWEREHVGYLQALCIGDTSGEARNDIIAGAIDGKVSAFSTSGRLLWSARWLEQQIDNIQAGYFSNSRSVDVLVHSASGQLASLPAGRRRNTFVPAYEQHVAGFALLADSPQRTAEILLGTGQRQLLLYTSAFQSQTTTFDLPFNIQDIFVPLPLEGLVRTPEILFTAPNQILAYTRGGKWNWSFDTYARVLSVYAEDLDHDGRLETLVGSEDRNLYLLDDQGRLRWRYYLPHSVLALDAVDLDKDGSMEILACCANGLLYVFNAKGDLIWHYNGRDPIWDLCVGDFDHDGKIEIAVASEDRLEFLQVNDQKELSLLIADCWSHLLAEQAPFEALSSLVRNGDPAMRAAALARLVDLQPFPPEAFALFEKAVHDTFATVRKVLPQAVMHVYAADPTRALQILNQLFTDQVRAVRIDVIENLLLLVPLDWNVVLTYIKRASESPDRTLRRAAIRKINHLIKVSQKPQAEQIFQTLLKTAQDSESEWIMQESGTAFAHLLDAYPEDLLVYIYQLLAHPLKASILKHIAYNLSDPQAEKLFSTLLALCLETGRDESEVTDLLFAVEKVLAASPDLKWSADIWLVFRELSTLSNMSSLEELAYYTPDLTTDKLLPTNIAVTPFLHVIERISTVTRPLKIYLRRDDLNDRLNSLLEGMNTLDALQRYTEREYGVSLRPDAFQPRLPEFVVLKILFARWQKMFRAQRGRPELACDLQSRQVHFEETVGIWLAVSNHGRSAANNVKVTLLSSETFEVLHATFETEVIFAQQKIVAEFLITPLPVTSAYLNLVFEIVYDDPEEGLNSSSFHERLDFIERQREFTRVENPYSTGTPAEGRMCYGRDKELAELRDNLTRTSAQTVLVLYGQRRSGKTTLLFQLTQTHLLENHIPVLIDMQRLAYNLDLCSFLFRIAYAIAQTMAKKGLAMPLPVRSEYVPDPTFAFDCFLDEVEAYLQDRKLILLLDEFEVLEEQVRNGKLQPEIFQYLRSLMQHHQYMHFLLSGTHHIEQLTRNYWSVFFQIAIHYRLPGKITSEGAASLITEPVREALEYEPLAVTKISQLTANQPYLIHLVCRSLVDHSNQQMKNYVSINDVNIVLRQVMETGKVHFDWVWNQILLNERVLLAVIAEGGKDDGRMISLNDISEIYHRHHIPYLHNEVLAALRTLRAADVVEVNEGTRLDTVSDEAQYYVSIGLLRQWLRREHSLEHIYQS